MEQVNRSFIWTEYVKNMMIFLQQRYPNAPREVILEFIRKKVKERKQDPNVQILKHDNFNSSIVETKLSNFVKQSTTKTITPSGSCYITTDVKVSESVEGVQAGLDKRKEYKTMMLDYKEKGLDAIALLYDFRQGTEKIKSNSLIGASGSDFSILRDKENFNAVTSLSRHGVMAAYAFCERFITNRSYFKNIDQVLNHIVVTIRSCPTEQEIMNIVNTFNLHTPTTEEIFKSLEESFKYYFPINLDTSIIFETIDTLKVHEKTFLLYHMNFQQLLHFNKAFFKDIFRSMLNKDLAEKVTVEPVSISKSFNHNFFDVITVVCSDILGKHTPKHIHKESPEAAKQIVDIGLHMYKYMEYMQPVLDMFLTPRCNIPLIDEHKEMSRKTTVISDTDSILFTVQDFINWYLDGYYVNDEADDLAAVITYIFVEQLAKIISLVSRSRGAINKFTKYINMKNEFTYPIFFRTNLGKHYFGLKTIQEGKRIHEYDIKGVNLEKSTIPAVSNKFTTTLIEDLCTITQQSLQKNQGIYASEFIFRVMDYETQMYEKLRKGDLTYVNYISINEKAGYKNPESSIFKNYELWENIFADKYDHIRLPVKVPIISFIPKIFIEENYLDFLSKTNKTAYEKIMEYPDKERMKWTRMPISLMCETIPKELVPAMDIRTIIYNNTTPSQLVLKSLGIDLNNDGKKKLLFMDYYSDIRLV